MQKNRSFNPDELFFNDMDPRAWERRTAEYDDLAYGDEYDNSGEEDDYFEDGTAIVHLSPMDQEDLLVQRVQEKMRRARATGKTNVSLSQEELEAYETKLLRQQQAPAARPPIKTKTSGATANSSANSSTRSKGGNRRTSFFSSPKPSKNQKSSGWKRPPSNQSDAPGFIVPGPNGQPTYAPITYNSRTPQARSTRSTTSPSRPGSRSASVNSRHDNHPSTPPRDPPGAYPTGSPHHYHDSTPPNASKIRPPSSSSRHSSIPDEVDWALPTRSRSSSSSVRQVPIQPQPPLVPFPVTPYQHYSADPYQYHVPSSSAPPVIAPQSQPLPQPQLPPQYLQGRRIVTGSAEGSYVPIPRRVPVPGQRTSVQSVQSMQGSYSEPTLGYRASGLRDELSDDDDDDDGQQGVLVDVVEEAGAGYNLQVVKPNGTGGGGGAGNDGGERRRRGRKR